MTARVVFARHAVIQHDFPFMKDAALLGRDESLRALGGAARARALRRVREEWLLSHAGVVSATQARGAEVNTRVCVGGAAREVWRPTRYGRGLVVSVETLEGTAGGNSAGLLDLKGAGVAPGRVPSLGHHSSGLCTLGEVLREFLFQTLIDEIFRRAAPRFWTVPAYAVIDPGFDVRLAGGEAVPAGMLVRRAHRRPEGGTELPRRFSVEEQTQVELELLLRHYGLTSSNRGTRFRFEEGAAVPRVFYAGGEVEGLSHDGLDLIRGWLRSSWTSATTRCAAASRSRSSASSATSRCAGARPSGPASAPSSGLRARSACRNRPGASPGDPTTTPHARAAPKVKAPPRSRAALRSTSARVDSPATPSDSN
jgi:hypothetical protein